MQRIILQPDKDNEKVAGLSLSEWTGLFWRWLLQTTDEANPLTTVGPARSWRYSGKQPTEFQQRCQDKYDESVWFVAAAPYTEPGGIIKMDIPLGKWWLLVAPAITIASEEMYPSLDTIEKLREHVYKDIRSTYELWTILDGFSVPYYWIDNTDRIIEIRDVPVGKHKNIMHHDLAKHEGVLNTLQAGYWNFIRPEQTGPGDHLLTIHSRSPVYHVDITYQLSLIGPPPSPSV